MDTACLKLKFNPLAQSIKGSRSTYCLEIVPEISCIENFDTLNWRTDSEVIEYTIPMTHKITLKKSAFKEYFCHTNKVYHSCVDLLSSKLSNENFGCGDVPRMMSDNLIITHCLSNKHIKENKTRLGVKEEKKEDFELLTVYIEDTHASDQSDISRKIECVEDTHNCETTSGNIYVLKPEKVIRICSASTNTTFNFDAIKNSAARPEIINYEKKLTLSPICSVSTEEDDVSPKFDKKDEFIDAKSNTKAFQQEIPQELYMQFSVFDVLRKPSCEIVKPKPICKIAKPNTICNNSCTRNNERMSKEAKYEQFMNMMEKELRPINMMFNDIVSKCITLGIHDKIVNKKQKAIDYNILTNSKDETIESSPIETMCKSKSRRAVYTYCYI